MSKRPTPLTPILDRLSSVTTSSTVQLSISASSTISPPTSPSSSSRTLTRPPRLHLRTLLPTPPLPKSRLALPPSAPYPWIWRCHLCKSLYRLGVTRRCLEDGHFFCSVPSTAPSPVSPPDSSPPNFSTSDSESDIGDSQSAAQRAKDEVKRKMAEKKRTKKTRRRIPRGCLAEFDYAGWGNYNTWRREVQISRSKVKKNITSKPALEPHASRITTRIKHWVHLVIGDDGKPVAAPPSSASNSREATRKRPKRNCWKDCDFPSECHNERKAEHEWEAKIRLERLRAMRDLEAERKREVWKKEHTIGSGSLLPELDNDPVVWSQIVYGGSEPETEHREVVHGGENMDPGTDITSSFQLDDPTLGPMGTDCDGLGEGAIQTPFIARRRSSVDEEMGKSPPTSPLKSSFEFADSVIPGLLGSKPIEVASGSGKIEDADLQLGEEKASRGRNLLPRRADPGDEEFGDEVED